MAQARLAVAAVSAAPAERVFALLTDWPRHSEWMFATSAEVTAGDGRSPGSRLAAFSGVGRLGFLDTMEITRWDPPQRVEVVHTGRVVRGGGVFRVLPLPDGGSRILWAETLDLPLGPLGALGWHLTRPLFAALVRLSLRRLSRLAETSPSPAT